jgi:hypothetical protein
MKLSWSNCGVSVPTAITWCYSMTWMLTNFSARRSSVTNKLRVYSIIRVTCKTLKTSLPTTSNRTRAKGSKQGLEYSKTSTPSKMKVKRIKDTLIQIHPTILIVVRHRRVSTRGVVTKATEYQSCRWFKIEIRISGTPKLLASHHLVKITSKKRSITCQKTTYDSD